MTGDTASTMMLFDLETDPAEQHNVASSHPDVVARLKALFDEVNKLVPKDPPRRREEREE